MRPTLRNEDGSEIPHAQLQKIISQKWKALEDDEREPYEKMARDDYARYEQEMEKIEPGFIKRMAAEKAKRKRKQRRGGMPR